MWMVGYPLPLGPICPVMAWPDDRTTSPPRKEDIRMSATNLVRLGFLSVLLGGAAVLVGASPAAAPTLADSTSSNSVVAASSASPARLAAANTDGSSLAGTLKL